MVNNFFKKKLKWFFFIASVFIIFKVFLNIEIRNNCKKNVVWHSKTWEQKKTGIMERKWRGGPIQNVGPANTCQLSSCRREYNSYP